jgi:hypothetical protein
MEHEINLFERSGENALHFRAATAEICEANRREGFSPTKRPKARVAKPISINAFCSCSRVTREQKTFAKELNEGRGDCGSVPAMTGGGKPNSLLRAFTPVAFFERLRGIIPSASKRRYEKGHSECEQKALFDSFPTPE